MAEKKDYYNVLGISKGANSEEIKAAYKNSAKQFHPDVSKDPNAKQKFQEVLEAYSVLNDPQKRQNYDQYGFAGTQFQGGQGQGFSNFDDLFRQGGMEFDFEDLFKGFGFSPFGEGFGGTSSRRRGPKRGNDLQCNLKISFEEAVFGSEKTIEVTRSEACNLCKGTGAEGKQELQTCQACQGRGVIQNSRRTPF
ncbi:MAG: DnaJ domain-containing protein, partial [Candidatus Diapherotrites archaeon]|nr:DnaJ domain-containing protein [Candidatus Diapherotrites archaeon]